MKDKMTDKKHMDYDRLCSMSETDLASEITDVAKLDKITEWCGMTPEERDEYKMKHHDDKDKMTDKMREHCTNAADCPMDGMHDKMKDHCEGDDCPMMDKKS